MFDFVYVRPFDATPSEIIDADDLAGALSRLTDAELALLEDELDFCGFAGVPSPRILTLLDRLGELDAGWSCLLSPERSPEQPAFA